MFSLLNFKDNIDYYTVYLFIVLVFGILFGKIVWGKYKHSLIKIKNLRNSQHKDMSMLEKQISRAKKDLNTK